MRRIVIVPFRYTASMMGLEEKVQEKEPKAPEFIMPLEELFVDEGDNAKFIAKVDGHPRPRVTWSINNIDIANVRRARLFERSINGAFVLFESE